LNKESLTIKIGYNKPVSLEIPNGITITILNRTSILIYSSDIKSLRNFLIKLRSIRKPDIYKAKGIQYLNETFKLKEIKKVL
jgi:large subunit ribosomal protein L6